jgi:ABC-type nitrate/sulfonate/bicarbonate transport system substrate-binding protein
VLLGATIDSLPFELWSIPSIKQYEQLKGTKLGVSRIGATTDFIARYLLKKWNLQPDREVAIFQTGSGPQVFAALKGGAVQSGVLSTGPETLTPKLRGFFASRMFRVQGLVYPFGPFAARQSFLKTHANLAMRFMKALRRRDSSVQDRQSGSALGDGKIPEAKAHAAAERFMNSMRPDTSSALPKRPRPRSKRSSKNSPPLVRFPPALRRSALPNRDLSAS